MSNRLKYYLESVSFDKELQKQIKEYFEEFVKEKFKEFEAIIKSKNKHAQLIKLNKVFIEDQNKVTLIFEYLKDGEEYLIYFNPYNMSIVKDFKKPKLDDISSRKIKWVN